MSNPLAYMGAVKASEQVQGIVEIATLEETLAGINNVDAVTPYTLAQVAIAGAPDASTTQKGIIEIATNGEAVAGGSNNLALVPSNMQSVFAAPPPIGSTTPNSGSFTTLTATDFVLTNPIGVPEGGTGLTTITDHGVMLGSGVGAVTPTSVGTTNQVFIGQTGADPIWSDNLDLPGSLEVTGPTTLDDILNVFGAVNISASLEVDSLVIDDITIDADSIISNAALGITATEAITITSTANSAAAIYLRANGGTSETIRIHSDQGTGVASVNMNSDVGGITLSAGLATADAINITTTNAGGGIDIDSGTAGFILDTTGAISLDSAAASNITVTGAFDLTVNSTAGSLIIRAGESAVDAVLIESTAGGVQILASGAAAGEDILVTATGSSVVLTATEATADAIVLNASNAAGGIDLLTGGGEITISSAGNVTMTPATATAASPTAGVTINARVGVATFTGFTTAAAATETFTITNSALDVGDGVFVTVSNRGTNDAQMTLTRVSSQTAGSLVVLAKNNGAAALNGNVIITFWIIN